MNPQTKRHYQTLVFILGVALTLGIICGINLLGFLQDRGQSREVEALRFELRKHGVLKGYGNTDREIINDYAAYLMVEDSLAWAVVKSENAREVALGGIISPIRPEILRRANPDEWPHLALLRGLGHYQKRFVRRHPDWWVIHCKGKNGATTSEIWASFFWNYRTSFVQELSRSWIGEKGEHLNWRKNVLTFWKEERR